MRNSVAVKWVGLKLAARHLCVSKETLYRYLYAKPKQIPAHRIGKLWVFDLTELDKWVKSGEAAKARNKKLKTK